MHLQYIFTHTSNTTLAVLDISDIGCLAPVICYIAHWCVRIDQVRCRFNYWRISSTTRN